MKRLSRANKVVAVLVPVLVGVAPSVAQPAKAQPNALDFYRRAGKALDYTGEGRDFPAFNDAKLNAPFGSPWARREVVLRHNAHALALMRQGFGYSYRAPLRKGVWDDVDRFMPLRFATRQLARLLHVEADVYEHRGEYAKAVNSGIDAVRLSKDISRGNIVAYLTGSAIASIGKSVIRKSLVDKLSAEAARKAAQRLENIETRNVSYADALREEKRFGQILLSDTFKEGKWRKEYPTTKTPRQLTVDYNRLMDEAIINATLPFPLRKATLSRANDELNKTMTDLYTGGAATTGWFEARDTTTTRLIMTMLALRAFKLEHGHYSATLNELAPNYLQRVPMDPFANNKPLRYKTTGIEYSLYSIGYDGVDDGGKALPKRARPNDKGDIVAGLNTR